MPSDVARSLPASSPLAGSPTARPRHLRLVALVDGVHGFALLIVLVSTVVSILIYDRSWWVDVIFDDGYYYLGIARGLAEQARSWFLPPFETNGYQPLWQMILWASAVLFGTSDGSLAIQAFAMNVMAVVLFCAASRVFYGVLAPAVLAAFHFTLVSLYGMETALLPVLVLCYFNTRDWRVRGGLATLMFFTRLDALALIVAYDLVNGVRDRRLSVRHYVVLIPAAAAYAILNVALFGVPVPVSGLVKAIGNARGENLGVVLTFAASLKYPLIAAGIVVLSAGLNRTWPQILCRREMAALLIAYAVSATYYGVNSGWGVWGWYFWPAMLLDFYLLLNLVNVLASSVRTRGSPSDFRVLLPLAACLVLVLRPVHFAWDRVAMALGPTHGYTDRKTSGIQNIALIEAIRSRAFPDETYFAMGDRAGSFGFFLGHRYRFLHTEGLVGPVAYYQAMRDDRGGDFVQAQPIDYLVTDRTAYLTDGDVLGVIEPVQGISAHRGPYMLCFPKSAIALQQTYIGGQRYLFDFKKRIPCPASLERRFVELRARPNGVRDFSVSW